MKHHGKIELRRLIRRHLWLRRWELALAGLTLLGVIAAELITPWPLKIVFDQILLAKPLPHQLAALGPLLELGHWPALLAMAGLILLAALFGGACGYLQTHLTARIGHQLIHQLRCELFSRLQQFSLGFHHEQRSGELLTKLASDTGQLRDLFTEWALTLVSHLLLLTCMLGVMLWLNWRLTLLVMLTLPMLVLVAYVLNARVRQSVVQQRQQEGRMAARAGEVLGAISLVQAFGRHEYEEARFHAESSRNLDEGVRNARASAALTRAINVLSATATAATVLVGAHQVLQGRLSPGELLIFMSYVRSLYKPLRDLGKLSVKFSRARVSANRIAELLGAESDTADAPDAIEAHKLRGEIEFDNVSFGYQTGKPVLDRICLRIKVGERVALVGGSGAGKSTLVGLLLRLYEPWSGRILIDGVDIRKYTRASLRRELGIVLQDTVLFGVSIRDNIAYGRPEAGDAEIEHVARLANAHEFIQNLPDGYETEVGERGCTLSGGQRQRLCLARALLKHPSILVLDEPTSAVDRESAELIGAALEQAHAGRTIIVIAHQFAGLSGFDRVIRLCAGALVESSPDALSAGVGETVLRRVR